MLQTQILSIPRPILPVFCYLDFYFRFLHAVRRFFSILRPNFVKSCVFHVSMILCFLLPLASHMPFLLDIFQTLSSSLQRRNRSSTSFSLENLRRLLPRTSASHPTCAASALVLWCPHFRSLGTLFALGSFFVSLHMRQTFPNELVSRDTNLIINLPTLLRRVL